MKARLRILTKRNGTKCIIETAYAAPDAKSNYDLKADEVKEIQDNFKALLGTEDLSKVDIDSLMMCLNPDNPVERIAYRRQFSQYTTNKKDFVKIKGNALVGEAAIERSKSADDNPQIGFKHARYEVSESNVHVNITITKKVDEDVTVRIKTMDVTATAPKDYEAMDYTITIKANEKERVFQIKINNDAEWEPDKDFKVILIGEDDRQLKGSDSECTVTILDDEKPGILGFEERFINVRRVDEIAVVKIIRSEGSDGVCECKVKTEAANPDQVEGKLAKAGTDYEPIDTTITMEHNVIEYTLTIQLPDCKNET